MIVSLTMNFTGSTLLTPEPQSQHIADFEVFVLVEFQQNEHWQCVKRTDWEKQGGTALGEGGMWCPPHCPAGTGTLQAGRPGFQALLIRAGSEPQLDKGTPSCLSA